MAQMTPQQIAVAAAKRRAAIAARKATGGMTVRQQRAAAKAAKMNGQQATNGSTSAPPPPRPTAGPTAAARPTSRQTVNSYKANPAPTYRGLKLVALAAFENAFVLKVKEQGITTDARDGYAKYQKLKALALGTTNNSATQNEADTALRMAVIHLVKLAF